MKSPGGNAIVSCGYFDCSKDNWIFFTWNFVSNHLLYPWLRNTRCKIMSVPITASFFEVNNLLHGAQWQAETDHLTDHLLILNNIINNYQTLFVCR